MERATLRDGATIEIRPIRPSDKQLLLAAFERLNAESRYRRFMSPINELRARELAYLTEVDHEGHEALVALAGPETMVGVARYVTLHEDPAAAEFAVTVADDWQGRGVATELLQALVGRALAQGIGRCHATCLAGNATIVELLEELGPVISRRVHSGTLELDIELSEPIDPHGPLRSALRHAAGGNLVQEAR